jgi:hypothetical protein
MSYDENSIRGQPKKKRLPSLAPLWVFLTGCNSEHCMLGQELARKRLSLELAREKAVSHQAKQKPGKRDGSVTAAAVGASLGAGLGIVMAVIMGAASALRKP